MSQWKGVFPAVTTKMRESGEIDLAATQSSIDRLIKNGVSGIIVLPMLGENASLSSVERESVIRAGKEVVGGRVPFLSGLSATTTAAAADMARAYASFGAEGFMAFPTLGYKTDHRETVEWYKSLARASDLPIMIYNNPIAYGVDVTPAALRELSECQTIKAVKEETGDVRRVTDMYIELGDRFDIDCGVADQIVESASLGAVGSVSGMTPAGPREWVALFNLCMEGDFSAARDLYRILTPSFHLDTHVKLVQYIKMAESIVYGAPEWCRAPRLPLVGAEREMVIKTVKASIAGLKSFKI